MRVCEAGLLALAACGTAGGDIQFMEATDRGLAPYTAAGGFVHGAAAADYDGDGDVDLLVATAAGEALRLYQNDGTGHFTDVAASVGLTATERDRACLFLDFDGDGDLDILTGSDNYFESAVPTTLRLYERLPGGTYTDVTVASGLFEDIPIGWTGEYDAATHLGSLAAGDLDADGDVDIVGTFWFGRSFRFRNNGDGTFTNVTNLAGISPNVNESNWQALLFDANGDGLLDVWESRDFGANRMFINNGGWSFSDMAPFWLMDTSGNEMGAAATDYDNDGDLDLYVTNIHDPQQPPINPNWGQQRNLLFEALGPCAVRPFQQSQDAAGVGMGEWGWGCTWGDYDHDGWVDLAATNGFDTHDYFSFDRSRLWRNLGGSGASPVRFEEVGLTSGVDDTDIGTCLLSVDVDRDGDLDLIQLYGENVSGGQRLDDNPGGSIRLLINETAHEAGEGRSVVVRPRRTDIADRFSIGATVVVEANGQTMMRLITAGTSMAGQEPYEAHFGLGGADVIDRIEVRWLDGTRRAFYDLPAPSGPLTVDETSGVEPCPGDVDDDGDTDVFDFNALTSGFGSGPCPEPVSGDANGDGVVDVFDFNTITGGFGCVAGP